MIKINRRPKLLAQIKLKREPLRHAEDPAPSLPTITTETILVLILVVNLQLNTQTKPLATLVIFLWIHFNFKLTTKSFSNHHEFESAVDEKRRTHLYPHGDSMENAIVAIELESKLRLKYYRLEVEYVSDSRVSLLSIEVRRLQIRVRRC